jgi:hypothetical protein
MVALALAWPVHIGKDMSLGKRFEFVRVRSTNECTTCDLCGRVELKCTIELIAIDRETGDREEVYYGSGCAKKALGWGPGNNQRKTWAQLDHARERAAQDAYTKASSEAWAAFDPSVETRNLASSRIYRLAKAAADAVRATPIAL